MTDPKSAHLDVDDGGCVLLYNHGEPTADEQSCVDLLSRVDPGRANLLAVTYRQSPDSWYRRWIETIGEQPTKMGIISVGELTRETSATIPDSNPLQAEFEFPVVSVSATAVTDLGIEISRHLAGWRGNSNRTVVCFDSITAMLQWTEIEPAFRFLHVLTARLSNANAIAHFHCDPAAHDEMTIKVLEPLFDHVIDGSDHEPNAPDFYRSLNRPDVSEALQAQRRRLVLQILIDTPGYVTISELADAVVASSMGPEDRDSNPATDRQRAMTQLHHTDLPKLAAAGLVTYDSQENVASLAIPSAQARSLLDGDPTE